MQLNFMASWRAPGRRSCGHNAGECDRNPLAAADPRIRAAIFGGVFVYDAVLEAARTATIPIEFLLPWDDAEIDRESGLALFDTFASEDKTLHAFPGSPFRVPAERMDTRFFEWQFGNTAVGVGTSG
jgi:hypothetical protein